MANNSKSRKRSRPTTVATDEASSNTHNSDSDGIPWKKVEVGLLAPSQAAAGVGKQKDDEDFEHGDNHYDAPSSKAYRSAGRELEGGPSEGIGMFFGLEVLDGSQYTVVEEDGHKRIIMKGGATKEGDAKAKNKVDAKKKASSGVDESSQSESKVSSDEGGGETNKTKSKRKMDIKESSSDQDADGGGEATQQVDSPTKGKKKKQKKKKKKKKPKKAKDGDAKDDQEENSNSDNGNASQESQIQSLQSSWMAATGGVILQNCLCKSLLDQNFWTPTPIQAASLPAAIMGRRNIVGAAPTGSGKTLAYLLPILEYLLQNEEKHKLDRKLHALILAPTRELALQVQKECNKLLPGKCGSLVGGLATQKQERVLRKNKPPIIIATPGRLWEMISTREHEHLNDMSQIAFLVIDECDRMTEQGSFPQLHRILDAIQKANPMDSDDEDEEDLEDELDDGDDPERLLSLPGIRGEAKVVMLNDDLLSMIENQKSEAGGEKPEPVEVDDEDLDQLDSDEKDADDSDSMDDDEISLPASPPVQRQTFVYSATLTLPPSDSYIPSRNKRRKAPIVKGVEGAILEILEKARSRGQTKVIDLSNSKKQSQFNEKMAGARNQSKLEKKASKIDSATPKRSFNLPPGLRLQEIKCTQMHKDSHLYAYLLTTQEGSSGPCLVFCNSIKAVRRVGLTLQSLGLPVRMLHANMQQRARFRAVESLQSDNRAVVVASDIAARGLDLPNVASVVHYDVARKVDGFVHRAGRTARGMGEKAVGVSLSLISPAEDKAHRKIVSELNVAFEHVHLDSRLLSAAQERTNLASKVLLAEDVEGKAKRNNQWFIDSAKAADLDIDDDDVFDEGLAGGNQKEQQQLIEAQRAKALLRQKLAEPLVTQRFGKFLSSNSAAKQTDVAPYVVQAQNSSSNRQKKRRKKS